MIGCGMAITAKSGSCPKTFEDMSNLASFVSDNTGDTGFAFKDIGNGSQFQGQFCPHGDANCSGIFAIRVKPLTRKQILELTPGR